MTECINKDIALLSENVLLVISHDQKKIYTWIGRSSAPHSKFACARETARIRMELGYKIVNLEEEATNNDFLRAIDEACNATGEFKPKPKPQSKTEPEPQPEPEPKSKTTTAKAKSVATKPKPKPKTEKTEVARRYDSAAVKTKIVDVEHVLKQLEILQPIENSVRDYVIIGETLFIAPESLEKPDSESKVNLPDGSFVADDYIPRLFLENGKIIAIELWREN